jgi:hypothetical protein
MWITLHHDNAPAHCTPAIREFLVNHNILLTLHQSVENQPEPPPPLNQWIICDGTLNNQPLTPVTISEVTPMSHNRDLE